MGGRSSSTTKWPERQGLKRKGGNREGSEAFHSQHPALHPFFRPFWVWVTLKDGIPSLAPPLHPFLTFSPLITYLDNMQAQRTGGSDLGGGRELAERHVSTHPTDEVCWPRERLSSLPKCFLQPFSATMSERPPLELLPENTIVNTLLPQGGSPLTDRWTHQLGHLSTGNVGRHSVGAQLSLWGAQSICGDCPPSTILPILNVHNLFPPENSHKAPAASRPNSH